jgi:acyl-CoA thioester hydrolase
MSPAATSFRHPMRVGYSEVDFQGIVYVAHYVTYFDHGIHEFFRALPYDYTAVRKTTGRWSVARSRTATANC